MNTDEHNRIVEFEEKPKEPKNNMASMGIYIFNWKMIKEFLKQDENNSYSSNDFGKDVIPALLKNNKKLFAYSFKGYWKDVGTIQSYWEANMDLLKEDNKLNLYEEDWKIYSNNSTLPPQYIGSGVKVENSMISDGCVILGDVFNSVLFPGVHVDKNSRITDSVILPNVTIESNVIIDRAIIGNNCIIRQNNIIADSNKIVLIGEDKEIGLNSIAI
jgi:glucose-1-phosphate adenylyltransferase